MFLVSQRLRETRMLVLQNTERKALNPCIPGKHSFAANVRVIITDMLKLSLFIELSHLPAQRNDCLQESLEPKV